MNDLEHLFNAQQEPSPEFWAGNGAVVLSGLTVDQTGNILTADQGGDIYPSQAP